ncbi:MAG: right-handed parallel beta-helix repeat-containing protein [Planctomycetota bacterium]|nr:right-handed parallel beta-helix repeat-containing protein [Planctomycetota bacterium]
MRKVIAALALATWVASAAFAGQTFYAATNGDDGAPGSQEKPWKTLSAAAETLKAGDTLVVAPGTYGPATLTRGGSAGAPVTIRAAEKLKAIVDGKGGTAKVETGTAGFAFKGPECRHVVLEGFEIVRSSWGVLVDGGASFIEVTDCDIHGCRMGVKVAAGTDCVFRRLKLHDNKYGMHLGDKDKNRPHRMLVEDCEARNNHNKTQSAGDPISKDNCDGFCVECGDAQNIVFRRCFASGSTDAAYDLKPDDVVLENCIAGGDCAEGFKLWRGARLANCLSYGNSRWAVQTSGGSNKPVEMINCTLVVGKRSAVEVRGQVRMVNCIVVGAVQGAVEEDYSLLSEGAESARKGQHSLTGDPKFKDPAKGDFHLHDGSPAVDSGTSAGAPQTDLDGSPRPKGKGPDMGAYER